MQRAMSLYLDTTGVIYTVSKAPMPRLDAKGAQRIDRLANRPMWITQVVAQDPEEGANVLDISTAGERPNLSVNDFVSPVRLQVIPWMKEDNRDNGGRNSAPVKPTLEYSYKASDLVRAVPATPAQLSSSAKN
jgi:hypothetical protein